MYLIQLLDQASFFSKNQYVDQARIVRIVLTCTQQLDNTVYNIHLVSNTFLLGTVCVLILYTPVKSYVCSKMALGEVGVSLP